jgi:hypothetical protein
LSQKFLIFRDGKVIKLSGEKGVGVIELTPVRRFRFDRRGFG